MSKLKYKNGLLICFQIVVVVFFNLTVIFAQSGNFITIYGPRLDVDVIPEGINNAGDIFGYYGDGTKGFKYSNGTFTVINPPGSIHTIPEGMNEAGEIAGWYYDSNVTYFGFKFSNGVTTSITSPGYNTKVEGISESGTLYGTYWLDGEDYQFIIRNGVLTTITPHGSIRGITPSGDVYGTFFGGAGTRGFLYRNGNLTYMTPPFNSGSYIVGITGAGEVIGGYNDRRYNNAIHTYKYLTDGNYHHLIIFSENTAVKPMGINSTGEIYGTIDGDSRGFRMSSSTYQSTVFNSPVGGRFTPLGINNSGAIYGIIRGTNNLERAFKYTGTVALIDGPGAVRTFATGMNHHGTVVGYYIDASNRNFGFKYKNGVLTTITGPNSTNTKALGINDAGTIIGTYDDDTTGITRAFLMTENPPSPAPEITNVLRTYTGYFLTGVPESNSFDVRVDWRGGQPGKVRFQINNNPSFEVPATTNGIVQPFNLNSFTPSYTPSQIKITPINSDNTEGQTRTELIYVFPRPAWLQNAVNLDSNAFNYTTGDGQILFNFNIRFPPEPYGGPITMPGFVPFFGGRSFGVKETQGRFLGTASSLGNGTFSLGGMTGFTAAGRDLSLTVSGDGTFLLDPSGFSIPSASFNLNGEGKIPLVENWLTAVPGLQQINGSPRFAQFLRTSKFQVNLKPSVAAALTWKQNSSGNLVFNEGTGSAALKLDGVLEGKIGDRFSYEASASGGGRLTLGAPEPYFRGLDLTFESAFLIRFDYLLRFETGLSYANSCRLTVFPNLTCESADSIGGFYRENNSPRLETIKYNFKRFGSSETLKSLPSNKTFEISRHSVNENTVLSNVYPGAEPVIIQTQNNKKLMVYVRQNTSLPVLQSTDIAWSFYNGTTWSIPQVINGDSRAEFSPRIGFSSNGKIVAVWLRVKDPAFNTPINTMEDLPLFYRQTEVVTAVFDPTAQTWSGVTQLTDDSSFDTNLRLAHDQQGNLLLAWQSNPGGEFMPTTSAPGTLKYCFWNGSAWGMVGNMATGIKNTDEFSIALKGNNAFAVAGFDPDLDQINDSVLTSYVWNGANWSASPVFAQGGGENLLPLTFYDNSGVGQVVWRQGTNLVRASLSNPAPQIIRENSDSSGFSDLKVFSNARHELALVWNSVSDEGSGKLFARTYNPANNRWSEDFQLSQTPWQSSNASGYLDNNGKLQIVFVATEILRTTRTVVINGQSYQIENVPENGQTDIRSLEYSIANNKLAPFDFDGDGRTDIGVWRAASGSWWYLHSSDLSGHGHAFGLPDDIITPGDYTGDGKADVAVWRPTTGEWFVRRSEDGSYFSYQSGLPGDIPAPADYDGDGITDTATFRPSTATWYIYQSGSGTYAILTFGLDGDRPVPADYDGDGKTDIAVWRASNGTWWIVNSSNLEQRGYGFGLGTDRPVVGDYTGDGKADIAVWRDSTREWFFLRSEDGSYYSYPSGLPGDIPAPGDYDGDGRFDSAVFRPSTQTWYIDGSTAGSMIATFGLDGDRPVPNAYVP